MIVHDSRLVGFVSFYSNLSKKRNDTKNELGHNYMTLYRQNIGLKRHCFIRGIQEIQLPNDIVCQQFLDHIPVLFGDFSSSLSLCHQLFYPKQFCEYVHDTFLQFLSTRIRKHQRSLINFCVFDLLVKTSSKCAFLLTLYLLSTAA